MKKYSTVRVEPGLWKDTDLRPKLLGYMLDALRRPEEGGTQRQYGTGFIIGPIEIEVKHGEYEIEGETRPCIDVLLSADVLDAELFAATLDIPTTKRRPRKKKETNEDS